MTTLAKETQTPALGCKGHPFMVRPAHLEAVDQSDETTDEAAEEHGQD